MYLAVPTTIVCGAMLPIAYLGFLRLQRSAGYHGGQRPSGRTADVVLIVAMLVVIAFLVSYLMQKL